MGRGLHQLGDQDHSLAQADTMGAKKRDSSRKWKVCREKRGQEGSRTNRA